MIAEIINFLIENDDFDFGDVKDAYPVEKDEGYSLDHIKSIEPDFFNRENTRFFGTKKIYKYGNFLVLKNRRKSHGHFGNISYHTSYVIYEFIFTHDHPKGLLLHRGSSSDLQDAKLMIKTKDFRSRRERLLGPGA